MTPLPKEAVEKAKELSRGGYFRSPAPSDGCDLGPFVAAERIAAWMLEPVCAGCGRSTDRHPMMGGIPVCSNEPGGDYQCGVWIARAEWLRRQEGK